MGSESSTLAGTVAQDRYGSRFCLPPLQAGNLMGLHRSLVPNCSAARALMRASCRHLASPVARSHRASEHGADNAHCAAAVVHSRFKRLYTVTMISKLAPLLLAAVVALVDTAV